MYLNQIKEIDGKWFKDLSNLKELVLRGNKPIRIDLNSLKGQRQTNLKLLNFSSNLITITSINGQSFQGFSSPLEI